MRSIFGLVRAFFLLTLLTAIGSAIGAAIAKNRLFSKGEPGDDELDLVAIYTGLDTASRAKALRRASFLTWYGGGTLDLRHATLDPAGATLTVRAIFGGFRLVVPETWRVDLRVVGIFGGVGDGRSSMNIDPNGPVLTVEGFAVFGGVGIVSEAPDLDEGAETVESLPLEPAPIPA